MARTAALLVCALAALATVSVAQDELMCKTFADIYSNGAGLCNTMFGSAFVYSEDLDNSYSMWFFDQANPNDAVTARRGESVPGTCELQYFHKGAPSAEPDSFTECHPWKASSCCSQGTVETVTKIKESYGPEYHWDRCGPVSQACERFFVQEACFYECEPNAGLFRRYPNGTYNASDPTHNEWEMYEMPIRADYCNAWFDACRHDLFCGSGDFFSCALIAPEANVTQPEPVTVTRTDDSLSTGAIAGIAVVAVVSLLALAFVVFLVIRERNGRALFVKLDESHVMPMTAAAGGSGPDDAMPSSRC